MLTELFDWSIFSVVTHLLFTSALVIGTWFFAMSFYSDKIDKLESVIAAFRAELRHEKVKEGQNEKKEVITETTVEQQQQQIKQE